MNASLISGLGDPGHCRVGVEPVHHQCLSGTISEYSTAGALVERVVISGLSTPCGIGISG